jgi:hypothetical protein
MGRAYISCLFWGIGNISSSILQDGVESRVGRSYISCLFWGIGNISSSILQDGMDEWRVGWVVPTSASNCSEAFVTYQYSVIQ